jgi:phosphate starvation-inducible PhoH-like protein
MSGRGRKKTKPFMETHRDAHDLPEGLMKPVRQSTKPQITLTAQTPTQKVYLRKLGKRHHDILFATGPAGTGKTYLAVVHAIKELRAGNIKKIVITRPNVGAGDELGHLPGNLIEKMAPWMRPVLDVFKEFYDVHEVERMIRDEVIEIAPLVFMRGRTLKNAYIIADEMQNATPEQMKMFLTRIGENSMMIITGDMEQHDRPDGQASGLTDFIQRFRARDGLMAALPAAIGGANGQSPFGNDNEDSYTSDYNSVPEERSRIGFVSFSVKDVVRHEVIEDVLALYA